MKHKENLDLLLELTKRRTGMNVLYLRRRNAEIILAKACVINVMSKYFGANTVQIGELFDMHHSTVIHHLQKHHTRYKYEDEYASLYDFLMKSVMQKDKDTIDVDGVLSLLRNAMAV